MLKKSYLVSTKGVEMLRCALIGLFFFLFDSVQSAEVKFGVNRTNLTAEKDWLNILGDMRKAGVKAVRLTMSDSSLKTVDTIVEANRIGMDVLLNIPLSLGSFYPKGTERRVGNGTLRSVHKLSNIDLGLFDHIISDFLEKLSSRKGEVSSFELGNEINWADFNGDLPVSAVGVIFEAAEKLRQDAPTVETGFIKYGQIVTSMRHKLHQKGFGRSAIISAGFVEGKSPYIIKIGGSALTLDLTLKLLNYRHVLDGLDGIAVHVYPRVGNQNLRPEDVVTDAISTAEASCQLFSKKCYITEWGFYRPDSCGDDNKRKSLIDMFVARVQRSKSVVSSYLFDWDASKSYRIYRCGHVVDGQGSLR